MFDKFRAKASEMTLKAGLKIRKHSPEILFGAGVVLFVGTIVMTVKAAPKVNDILEEHNEKREILNKKKEESPEYVGYSKDLAGLYKRTAIKTAKVVLPVVAVGTMTVGCFGGANYILFKRLGALSTEYMILDKAFKTYRSNVVAEDGIDKDKKYYYSLHDETVTVPTLNEEGQLEDVKKTETIAEFEPSGSRMIVSKETVKNGWFSGNELYDESYIESIISGLKDDFERRKIVTRTDVYKKFGLYDALEKGKASNWMFGKIFEGRKDDLVFKVTRTYLPDYEAAHGDRLVFIVSWNEENLYNKL